MSKLLKLKEWLTIPAAATHLSGLLGEAIEEADVLQLGLEGHLKLSVYFVNGVPARLARRVSFDQTEAKIMERDGLLKPDSAWNARLRELGEARKSTCSQDLPEDVLSGLRNGELFWMCTDLHIAEDQYVHLVDNVTHISGLWDLMMVGAEVLDVEHRIQQLISGVDVTGVQLEGPFVDRPSGEVAQIHARFTKDELRKQAEFSARLREKSGRPPLVKKRDRNNEFYPAGGLPLEDSILVVRPTELLRFQSALDEVPNLRAARPESPRERNTLLRIIGAMLADQYKKDANEPFKLAAILCKVLEGNGVDLSDDTVAKHLSAAQRLVGSSRQS